LRVFRFNRDARTEPAVSPVRSASIVEEKIEEELHHEEVVPEVKETKPAVAESFNDDDFLDGEEEFDIPAYIRNKKR
jgi:hypothetical protein